MFCFKNQNASFFSIYKCVYIYIYVCVCVCACVSVMIVTVRVPREWFLLLPSVGRAIQMRVCVRAVRVPVGVVRSERRADAMARRGEPRGPSSGDGPRRAGASPRAPKRRAFHVPFPPSRAGEVPVENDKVVRLRDKVGETVVALQKARELVAGAIVPEAVRLDLNWIPAEHR